MDSILTSIKKLLGIAEEYEHFDPGHRNVHQFGILGLDAARCWS